MSVFRRFWIGTVPHRSEGEVPPAVPGFGLMSRLAPKSASESIAWLVFVLALCQFAFFTCWTIDQPMVDRTGFRPAQTLISVQYMLRGLGWFANIVPIFGEPWVISQEFPLYQWCVALLVWLTGAPIDACGRVVSASFAVAVIGPIWLLAKDTLSEHARRVAPLVGGVWLLCPAVIFWGRSGLIETTTVFLGLCWLAFYVRFLKNHHPTSYLACLLFGMLAATVKITTFGGFVFAGLLYTFAYLWNVRHNIRGNLMPLLLAGSSVALSVSILFAWNGYTTRFLVENPLANITSVSNMPAWYFGLWNDRYSPMLWEFAIRDRDLPEILGKAWRVLAASIICLVFLNIRFAGLAILAVLTYLSVYMVFPRLHTYNEYYQVEGAIFICGAVVAVVEGALRRKMTIVAYCFLGIVIGSQMTNLYGESYGAEMLKEDLHQHPFYQVGLTLKKMTPPDSVIVVFGVDWGSDVPYFAERRAIIVTNWMPVPIFRRVLFDERDRWFGHRKLGAVVDCSVFQSQLIGPEVRPLLDELKRELNGRTVEVPGASAAATVVPSPKCTVYLPHE
jgi:hypothetical protein